MSDFARNHHPTGRDGKMLAETVQDYSFCASVLEITFAALYLSSSAVPNTHEVAGRPPPSR
jgi:hypothetical protein